MYDMRIPARAQAIGMGLSFWAIFLVVYPVTRALELGSHALALVQERIARL